MIGFLIERFLAAIQLAVAFPHFFAAVSELRLHLGLLLDRRFLDFEFNLLAAVRHLLLGALDDRPRFRFRLLTTDPVEHLHRDVSEHRGRD